MIGKITVKFGTELKPTQVSWKSQLYNIKVDFLIQWSDHKKNS